jgi:putative nucleotidyltransferase with HDIG domain
VETSERKYIFTTERYMPAPVSKLVPGKRLGFPLFIHFLRNNHLVMRYDEHDSVTEAHLNMYKSQGFENLWIPIGFESAWKKYSDDILESDSARSEEAAVAIDIITSADIDDDEKFAALKEISQGILTQLASIHPNDPETVSLALARCREFTEDIIRVTAKTHIMGQLYEAIVSIAGKHLEHSTTTSSFATLFAMGLGYADTEVLSDIALAGLLHDVGYAALDPILFITPESEYTIEQHEEMQRHIDIGLELIEKSGIPLSPTVRLIIEEHHERFDGTGFPNGKEGLKLSELSQIVALADFMEDLMKGRINGKMHSPKETFDFVGDLGKKAGMSGLFHPEILGIILEVMQTPISIPASLKATGS